MKHIIIGASAAGLTAAKTIRVWEPKDEITVISVDTKVHSRCMLHQYLSGSRTAESINFAGNDFFKKQNIRWVEGEKVIKVDCENNKVHLECGAELAYDKLLIATGAQYIVPPIGSLREGKNVFGLRDLSDAEKIDAAAKSGARCVIVGSGLVGLDAAYALSERGVKCDIVEMADSISPLQLNKTAAKPYQSLFEKHGCTFHLSEKAAGTDIDSSGNITAINLESGKTLPCDFVIMAAGVRPNIDFLKDSGIQIERAVKVDNTLRTNIPNVWAAGDCAGITGIWPNAMEQGEVAAKNMCGTEVVYDNRYGMKNTMNFYGLTTLSLGIHAPNEGDQVYERECANSYQRFIIRDGKVVHVLLQGDISNSGFWQELVKRQVDISGINKPIFDLSYADFYEYEPAHGKYDWVEPIK